MFSIWSGAQHTTSSSAVPDHFQWQGDYQKTKDGSSCETRDLRNFTRILPAATDYTNAMISSGPALDDNGLAGSAAHESLSSLLCPPGVPGPANANFERHQLFHCPPHPMEACSFPADEHSHHCSGHEEYQHYNRQSNLQQSHGLSPTSAMMEREDSHRSINSTHSRRSRRSLPPGTARYASASCGLLINLTLLSRRIACETCNKWFHGQFCRRNLTRHTQTAHRGNAALTYVCMVPGCDHAYKRSDALRVHEGKAHPTLFAPRESRSKRPDE